jgi:hypothetical protein
VNEICPQEAKMGAAVPLDGFIRDEISFSA